MTVAEKLLDLGYELPEAALPAANYVPYIVSGHHVYISGQIPFLNGKPVHPGRLGDDLTIEQGQEAARVCALNILAQLRSAVDGEWERVERCIKLGGFVNCMPEFNDHPKVINGASDLMVAVLGEDKGSHTRFAVGASSLPLGVSVQIDALFSLKNTDF